MNLSTINWWWAFWVLSSIYENIVNRMYLRATGLQDEIMHLQLDGYGAIADLVLCALAIKVIKDYSEMENTLSMLTQINNIDDKPLQTSIHNDTLTENENETG